MEKIKLANIDNLDEILKIQEISNINLISKENLKNDLNNTNCRYFIFYIDDIPVGFIGISYILNTMDILSVLVNPKYQNKKIASKLLEHVINFSNKNNINEIFLEVRSKNLVARHLYEKFNFKEIDMRKNYYKNDNAIIYKLTIN